MNDEGLGTNPEQSGLAETYARSTSLGWIRIIATRGTQLIWIKIITQPEILSKELYGLVSFVALGASLVAGLAVPWVVWVMTQKGLAERDSEASKVFIHQMVVYGIIASLVLAPLLGIVFIFLASVFSGVPLLSVEGVSMMIPIAVTASLTQLFLGVYNCYLRIERNVVVGGARTVAYQLIPLGMYLVTRNIIMIFWGWVIADVLTIIVAIPTSGLSRKASLYRPKWPTTALMAFTLPIILLTVFDAFRGAINYFLTFVFFGTADFATYNLVIGLTTMATDVIITLMIPFSPIIIVMLKTRPERVGIALGTVLKMLAHAVLYVSPVLVFCGREVMKIITSSQYLGPETDATLSFATIMMAATVFNAVFLNLIGAKGLTYRLLYFEAFYALAAIPFYFVFAILGWLQVLGIAGMAICTALSFVATLLLLMRQTEELRQIGRQALTRVAVLGILQTGIAFILTLWLSPIGFMDLAIIAAFTLLSLFILSGGLSCFVRPELEIVSRASKGRLDRLIRFYELLGRHSRRDDDNQSH